MDRQRIRESTHAKRPHRRTDRLTSHRTRLPADPRRGGLPPTALVQYSRTCRHECFLRHVARGRSTIERDWCGNYRTRKRLACRPAIAGRLVAFDTRLSGCRICESPEQKSMCVCVCVCARARARMRVHQNTVTDMQTTTETSNTAAVDAQDPVRLTPPSCPRMARDGKQI